MRCGNCIFWENGICKQITPEDVSISDDYGNVITNKNFGCIYFKSLDDEIARLNELYKLNKGGIIV